MATINERVAKAHAQAPHLTHRKLGAQLGLTREQVSNAIFRIRHPERIHAWYRRWAHGTGRHRPAEVVHAERRAGAEKRAKPVLKQRARGRSFKQAGAALGITRNAVAGRVWRAKQREAQL
jgi:biotin operon repressor